jgi:hypothetical protein
MIEKEIAHALLFLYFLPPICEKVYKIPAAAASHRWHIDPTVVMCSLVRSGCIHQIP